MRRHLPNPSYSLLTLEVVAPSDLQRRRRLGAVVDDGAEETKSLERTWVLLRNPLPLEVSMRPADGRSKATGEPGMLPSVRVPSPGHAPQALDRSRR